MMRLLACWQLWVFAFWFVFALAVLTFADIPAPPPCDITCETVEFR